MSFVLKMKIFFVALLTIIFSACQRPVKVTPVVRTGFYMDTLVKISIFDPTKSEDYLYVLMDSIFQSMEAAENRLSVHVKNSEVQKINNAAGKDYIVTTADVSKVILVGKLISRETRGAFDITIGGIKSLWDFHNNKQIIPSKEEIQSRLTAVNSELVERKDLKIFIKNKDTRLDLGGIAKGFLVDQAVFMLKEAGIKAAIVEAGGDLRILGTHPSKPKWRIGVRHPRKPQGLYGILEVDSVSVTTSGDYERYFDRNGKRYHHILDPQTGFPASKSISVTVIAQSAMVADALATALFVMGPDDGVQFAEKKSGVECLILYEKDGRILSRMSSGMKSVFKPI